jgi:hypothetical protein
VIPRLSTSHPEVCFRPKPTRIIQTGGPDSKVFPADELEANKGVPQAGQNSRVATLPLSATLRKCAVWPFVSFTALAS